LALKCNLTRENLSELIQKKKASVGDGYLTDQGALFLVAADLGITIDYDRASASSIASLSKDQKSVTITCRILSVGYPKTFTRKTDSSKGLLLRLVACDDSATTTLSLWDRSVVSFLGTDIRPGDTVKISNAYTRLGIDGSIALNVGENSLVEKVANEKDSQSMKSLQERIQPLSKIPENEKSLIVRGRVRGEVRKTAFSRSDGSSSDLTSFSISDSDQNSEQRVVIWGNPNPVFSSLKDSETITLLNVRTKVSNFQNNVSVEIHGDETTCILERWDETKSWMKDLAKNYGVLVQTESQSVKNVNGVVPFIARIISIRHSDSEAKSFLLLVDSKKKNISLSASGESLKDVGQVKEDDVVLCKPETFDEAGLKASIIKEKTIAKLNSKRPDIPTSNSLVTRVEDLPQNGVVSLELMCLTDSVAREIQTKDGLVRRTELTVADHTGEIKVYGWRSLSKVLENYSAGDRLFLGAVEAQNHEGKKFLQLKNYSTVRKLES
jgi:replication factor A1